MELGERVPIELVALPAVAAVLATPELSVGEAGDEAALKGDERVRHRGQRFGQSAGERRPLAVTSVDQGLRVAPAVRRVRPGAGRHVPELRVARLDRDRPGVVPVPPLVGAVPGVATVLAPGGAAASGLVGAPRLAWMPRERVDVALRTWPMVVPGLPAVGRAHEPTELDPDEEQVGVVRAGRDPAHVRRPWSRREAPRRARGELEQACELHPGLSAIVAPIERARLGACVDGAVGRADREREDARRREPAVDPGGAPVGRPPDAALTQAGVHDIRIGSIEGEALSPVPDQRKRRLPSPVVLVETRDRITCGGIQACHPSKLPIAEGRSLERGCRAMDLPPIDRAPPWRHPTPSTSPLASRASWAKRLLLVAGLVDTLAVITGVASYRLADRAASGGATFEQFNAAEARHDLVILTQMTVYLVTAFVFILGFHRAYANLPAMGIED